ncbi:GNAT family N-acetyltransferase [Planococcus sp. CAU13]|uniref:GNAT family N-acetyltransferase n=1 Tax=Planococcus sp. CAU13 TaxID=1541197 RepID=UPI00068B2828|nr:GNAT family N-acetyltransferase [Planococcus sp. CAU13]
MEIKKYSPEYHEGWLRCRVLAYLHTSMYEDVVTSKPTFNGRPAIELIAVENGEVIGILDMVLDNAEQKTSLLGDGLGAFLQVIAVHPDHQSKGIGKRLYEEAVKQLQGTEIEFIELYTRDDEQANNFYKKLGFEMLLETYDVFGIEKGVRGDVFVKGIEDKTLLVDDEAGEKCDYLLVDGVYQVFTKEALEKIDYDRYYPARGYYKSLV